MAEATRVFGELSLRFRLRFLVRVWFWRLGFLGVGKELV